MQRRCTEKNLSAIDKFAASYGECEMSRADAGGLISVRTGVGFRSVTLLKPLTDESAALMARTVMVFGYGRVAGAV